MKRTKLKKISDRKKALLKEEPKENELHKWFLELWDKREDIDGNIYCFETGMEMPRRYYRHNSSCFSHILCKEMYPEYKLCEWNVKIVRPEEHFQYSTYPENSPKQYAEYKKLLKLHERGEL